MDNEVATEGERSGLRRADEVLARVVGAALTLFELFVVFAVVFGALMSGDGCSGPSDADWICRQGHPALLVVAVVVLVALSLVVTWFGIFRALRRGGVCILWPVLGGLIFLPVLWIVTNL
ncbi:hypothetical protein [Flexivirga oryzae]|uniref:Uncharacterized protein n=1 Tax=Flexivirga oryzae TaxID=1794944 RepID=A0A839N3X6_9MICO|nr:hypothetical protein [Flexivirga oryzae]MBB2892460.1 hypothetical protein [Flexivirga oryzae]